MPKENSITDVINRIRLDAFAEAHASLIEKLKTLLSVLTSQSKAVRKAVRKPRRKRAKQHCPVKGCKNVFAPRFGGYCVDHRKAPGYLAWVKARAPKKQTKRSAKKR